MSRTARRTACSGDGGAAAVEFGLLFPIFMTLALGILAAGMAFSKQINVTQAAREASRYGATYDIAAAGGLDAWLTAVDKAVTEAAGAANDPVGGYDYRCVAYVSTDAAGAVDSVASKHKVNGGSPDKGACPSTTAAKIPGTDYVQVALARESRFFVLFINPTLQLDSVSVTPYEGKAP